MIIPIGEWVLETACAQLSVWDAKYPQFRQLTISVNISGKQVSYPPFYTSVCKILEKTGTNPLRLNLEITESIILEDDPEILSVLSSLDKLGINLQLDDFGTGQSSLGYLKRFPLKTIKIDQSFISYIHQTQELGLVQGIIQLARALELKTVAEGVETQKQASTLLSLQCDCGQGFGISKPKFAHEIETMLSEQMDDPSFILPATDFQA